MPIFFPVTLLAGGTSLTEQLFTRGSETIITDFDTGASSITKVFDGTTSQAWSGGSNLRYKASTTFCYVGITFSSARPISRVITYGSSDSSYIFGTNPTVTIDLYGKAGTAPSSSTDGTLLGTTSFTDTATGQTINSSNTTTNYDHCWIRVSTASADSMTVAELTIYYMG